MTDARIERGPCRFVSGIGEGGKPNYRNGIFPQHSGRPKTRDALLQPSRRPAQEQAKKIADSLNDNVLNASIILTTQHPKFEVN
jgi:hypothetical protein